MSAIARFPTELRNFDNVGVFSDFVDDQSDTSFIDFVTDGGVAAVADGANGVMTLAVTDSTDEDEMSLYSANEIFLHAVGKPHYARAYLKFTEANTNKANVAFGFANAPLGDTLVDAGAGLRVTGSAFVIFKVDGGTVWKCTSQCNGTISTSTSTTTAGGAYQTLEVEIDEYTSTLCQATYYVDGKILLDSTTGQPIRHNVLYASATEMALFAAVKNGSTSPESLLIDYMGGWKKR